MAKLQKEIFIFIALFIFLALGMHMKQWISHPMEHLQHLSESQFGTFHPLYFTLLVYVVLYILRSILSFVGRLFKKD